jgi:(p)ppGpp synthase/HD superfamily hydrolase
MADGNALPLALRSGCGAAALALARRLYAAPLQRPGKTLDHPLAVARLVDAEGCPPDVVIAALLHDIIEDAGLTSDELRRCFGQRVARTVAALSEDTGIDDYVERKRALRERVAGAERDVAIIALADKLAKLRRRAADGETSPPRALEHYRESAMTLMRRHGPFALADAVLDEVALAAYAAQSPRATAPPAPVSLRSARPRRRRAVSQAGA